MVGPTDGHPRRLHTPPNIEEVYFPHASVVGDIGPSLAMLADRLDGDLPDASALLPLRDGIMRHISEGADDDRFPIVPQRIVADVRKVMPADGIVALDNGMYNDLAGKPAVVIGHGRLSFLKRGRRMVVEVRAGGGP